MPARIESPFWFEEQFGFKEGAFGETQGKFNFKDGVLTSTVNGASFHVGPFEMPNVSELRLRVEEAKKEGRCSGKEGLTFKNITGAAKQMHVDSANAGAVFQVASQFNCLEMNEPGVRPEDGVTKYCTDATQGPACALACPAGTVFRNYFVNGGVGQVGKHQIDCLRDVGSLVQNGKERFWKMKNGYCLPDADNGIATLGKRLSGDGDLVAEVRSRLRVGVHWDTEVKGGSHRVCQVFSSALPINYAKSVRSEAWAPLAMAILDGTYEATFLAGSLLAYQRGERVTVYLTAVGGGAFGNRSMWIIQAMTRALKLFADAPLDVRLVHFGTVPRGAYMELEKGRPKCAKGVVAKSADLPSQVEEVDEAATSAARLANGDACEDAAA